MSSIADCLAWLTGKPTFARGIHPPTRKESSAERPIEVLPTPDAVTVPLHQHAGAPAAAVVKPRTSVAIGDLIAQHADAMITANVHAPIAGVVQPLVGVTLPNGRHSLAVPIQHEGPSQSPTGDASPLEGRALWEAMLGGAWPVEKITRLFPREIVDSVQEAGVVGLGGAAFPTHVKLQQTLNQPIDTLLLNGCECEPYLTADYRLMIEAAAAVVAGLRLAMKACGARRGIIAVEDNKPQAIASLRAAILGLESVEVAVCQTKYPMGGERQLIPALLGQEVPTGGFPLDLGIVVLNVGTAAAVAAAVIRGRAMTHRVISVAGQGIRAPKNLLVPVGTPLQAVLDYCGGLTSDARRVVAGGPMMGFTVTDLNAPVTKGMSGLTVLSKREIDLAEQTNCIRCGRCLDVCPLGLAPTKIAHAAKFREFELAATYDLAACCECGCCAYACPSRIPLVQHIRAGKAELMRQRMKRMEE